MSRALPAGSPAGSTADPLPRRLGFWATTALVIGTIIGSGIFRVPAAVAGDAGSIWGVAAVWVLGGLITLCGALSTAELAAAFPESGGIVVYLRESYGRGMAFLYGWTLLFLAPAGTAALALVFGEYLGQLVPLSTVGIQVVASGVVAILAATSYRSLDGAGAIQGVATVGKVSAIAALILAAFLLGDGSSGAFGRGAALSHATFGGVGLGLIGALWSYNGFQDMVCVAGEVKDPGRVLPRALLVGNLVVLALYVAANAAYLYVLPYATLAASPLAASDAMVRVLGPSGAGAVAVMVMVSTFGAINGLVITQPRIFYAMARDGLLFASLARVHPRFATPHVALVAFGIVSVTCVWLRSFEQLTEAFVLGVWPFLALATIGVILLRRRRPELARPYRTPGYPVVPVVFALGTTWVVGNALVARPVTTLAGIGLTLLGVPIYMVWQRRSRPVPGSRV